MRVCVALIDALYGTSSLYTNTLTKHTVFFFQYFAPLDKTGKMRHMLGHLFSLQSLLRVPRLLEEMEPSHEDLMQVRLAYII